MCRKRACKCLFYCAKAMAIFFLISVYLSILPCLKGLHCSVEHQRWWACGTVHLHPLWFAETVRPLYIDDPVVLLTAGCSALLLLETQGGSRTRPAERDIEKSQVQLKPKHIALIMVWLADFMFLQQPWVCTHIYMN